MLARLLLCAVLLVPGRAAALDDDAPVGTPDEGRSIIVALAEQPAAGPAVGGTPRPGYGASYAASLGTQALAEALAAEYRLQKQGGWTIAPLKLHCLLFRPAPGADVEALLAALARDPRVQLAQPLNSFETLAQAPVPAEPAYNDPYVGLQRGFAAMDVAQAQRWSRGEGRARGADRHRARCGPSGPVRPHRQRARLCRRRPSAARPRRAAWHADGRGDRGRGEQWPGHRRRGAAGAAAGLPGLLGAVGGRRPLRLVHAGAGAGRGDRGRRRRDQPEPGRPAGPAAGTLLGHAIRRGIIVVGAVPPGGARGGFPVGVDGVLAVRSSDEDPGEPGIAAPGRDILTLVPGGSYDFATGSSLAAAQISGTVALLRALSPGLGAAQARGWLTAEPGQPVSSSCAAVRRLRTSASCTAALAPSGVGAQSAGRETLGSPR